MQYRPDITVHDPGGNLVAIVEVKALREASVQTATLYLQDLLSHGVAPRSGYVLLLTDVIGYLWSSPQEVMQGLAPRLTFPVDSIIQQYQPSHSASASISGSRLESVVLQWMWDVANGDVIDDDSIVSLRAAGFTDALRGGSVTAPASV